jgi:hypothetical protein
MQTIMIIRISLALALLISFSVQAQTVQSVTLKYDKLQVKINPVSKCHLGDLDLISAELVWEEEQRKNLILAIEPLSSDSGQFEKSVSSNLYIPDLTQVSNKGVVKTEAEIYLPKVKGKSLAGLYLCKDGSNQASCKGKTIQSFDEMIAVHHISDEDIDPETGKILLDPVQPQAREDKVYFFLPIIVSGDKITVFTKVKDAQEVRAYLKQAFPDQAKVVDEAAITYDAIGSLEARVENSTLTIDLPYNDISKCFSQ